MKRLILITPLLWGVFLSAFIFRGAAAQIPSVLPNALYSRAPASIVTTDLHARILAIRVDFVPDTVSTTTGNGTFNSGIPDTLMVDPLPHDRAYFEDHLRFIDNYFSKVSKGHVTVDSIHVYPEAPDSAYHLPNQMWHYNFNSTQADLNMRLAWLFRDAWQAAAADPAINFSYYNTFIIYHAGVGQDYNVGFDETPHDIPSAYFGLQDLRDGLGDPNYPGVIVNGDTIRQGLLLPESEHQQEAPVEIALNGTEALLFAHSLGLPMLYDTNTGASGVGRFDVMDQGSGNFAGMVPSLPCAWSRAYMGWETPVVITPDAVADTFRVSLMGSPDSTAHEIYRVNLSQSEYYLIENRAADPDSVGYAIAYDRQGRRLKIHEDYTLERMDNGFGVIDSVDNYDFGIPGQGILIWHVDDNVIAAKRDSNKVNTDMSHRGVSLVEADGADDIGRTYGFFDAGWGTELGWSGDFFFLGNPAFLAANHNLNAVAFNDNTYPSARSYGGGNTGLNLDGFSAMSKVMTFRAKNLWAQVGFPRVLVESPGTLSPSALNFSTADNKTDWILTVTPGGAVQAFDSLGRSQGAVIENHWRYASNGDSVLVPDTLLARLDSLFTTPAIITRDDGFTAMIPSRQKVYLLDYALPSGPLTVDTISLGASLHCLPLADSIHNTWYLGDDAGHLHFWTLPGVIEGDIPLFNNIPIRGLCAADSSIDSIFVLTASDSAALVNSTGQPIWKIKLGFIPAFPPVSMYHSTGNRWDLAAVGSGGEVALLDPATGAYQPGFPMNAGMAVTAPPNAADFDRDGREELLLTGVNRMQAVANNGALMANWPSLLDPRYPQAGILSQPAITTLGNNPDTDPPRVIFGWPGGMVDARDNYGHGITNFPRETGYTVASAPLLLQLDADDASEMAALDESGVLNVWNLSYMGSFTVHRHYWNGLAGGNGRLGQAVAGSAVTTQNPQLLIVSKVYPWPNPAHDVSHIRYKMGQEGTITVRIFDVSGDLVKELSAPATVGQEADLDWDLSGVSSGVYIGRVEAEGSGSKEKTFIKIAVVK